MGAASVCLLASVSDYKIGPIAALKWQGSGRGGMPEDGPFLWVARVQGS